MTHLALAGVGGHGERGPLRLRLAGTLNVRLGLALALHDRTGTSLGTALGRHCLLLGKLDVPGGFLWFGRRSRRGGDPETGELVAHGCLGFRLGGCGGGFRNGLLDSGWDGLGACHWRDLALGRFRDGFRPDLASGFWCGVFRLLCMRNFNGFCLSH